MGTRAQPDSLAGALFTPVQQRILALLYGQPDRSFQSAELIRLAASGTGAVHRQLTRMAGAGLLTVTQVGNQKHYRANPACPIFDELHGIVVKTVGLVGPIKRALAPLADRIHAAFVYGSVAKGSDRAGSDIDVTVLSDTVAHAELYDALAPAEAELARPLRPTLLTPAQWRAKRRRAGSFASRVAAEPRLWVIGLPDDVE